MNYSNYQKYISEKTMMGPNSVRILEELFTKYPLEISSDEQILDLGCGTGLTSLVIAKETGATVYANDLWINAQDNAERFAEWGVAQQVTPICEDANDLHFHEKQFSALVSVDSFHYFAGQPGFFQDKLLPFLKDDGTVLIGIPGLKNQYTGQSDTLLSNWLGDEAYLFKSPDHWREIIGTDARIETVETWEMKCFEQAWNEWLASGNEFACGDKQHFETIIKPYTCFVGIYIRLKK